MSETSSLHLFIGTREAFKVFCSKYQDLAKTASVLDPRGKEGLLGFLLSNPEYLALRFPPGVEAGPFVQLPPQLEEPIVAANATYLQVSIHNAHYAA